RMRLSVWDLPATDLNIYWTGFKQALINNTVFGTGGEWETPHDHPVMDADWGITHVTEALKDKAHRQLGTSGSGNHFAEFGEYHSFIPGRTTKNDDVMKLAFLTHSGSRGAGARVCEHYSKLAQS